MGATDPRSPGAAPARSLATAAAFVVAPRRQTDDRRSPAVRPTVVANGGSAIALPRTRAEARRARPNHARSINVRLRGSHRPASRSCSCRSSTRKSVGDLLGTTATGGLFDFFEFLDHRNRKEVGSGRSVSSRSSRGNGTSATSGIIARDAISRDARDQKPAGRLPAHQHGQHDQASETVAVDRVASNKTDAARSSHTHMARSSVEELFDSPPSDETSRRSRSNVASSGRSHPEKGIPISFLRYSRQSGSASISGNPCQSILRK